MNFNYWPLLFIAVAILFWGTYVPAIHHGQAGFTQRSPLHAFLFVGLAYFLVAVVVPLVLLLVFKVEPWAFTRKGAWLSTFAGVCGAIGALGVILALKVGGKPTLVAPLVFAGAPIMASFVALAWDRPGKGVHPLYWVGIVVAAAGAAMVLRFKP